MAYREFKKGEKPKFYVVSKTNNGTIATPYRSMLGSQTRIGGVQTRIVKGDAISFNPTRGGYVNVPMSTAKKIFAKKSSGASVPREQTSRRSIYPQGRREFDWW